MRLILNSIRTPDGTVLTSYYTHDFKMHTDKNGQQYGVDGGNSYQRRIGNTNECEDLSIWVDDENMLIHGKDKEQSYDVIRNTIHWGSRGKEGDQPLRHIKLKEMTDEHLNNLINVYKGPVDSFYMKCFKLEVEYRAANLISVPDGE